MSLLKPKPIAYHDQTKNKTQNQRVQKQAQQLLTKHLTTLFPTQMVEGSIQELMSFMPSQD